MSYKYVSKLYDYLIYKNGRGSCCGISVPSWIFKYVNKYTLHNFLTKMGLVGDPRQFRERLNWLIQQISSFKNQLKGVLSECGVEISENLFEKLIRNTFYDIPFSKEGVIRRVNERLKQLKKRYCKQATRNFHQSLVFIHSKLRTKKGSQSIVLEKRKVFMSAPKEISVNKRLIDYLPITASSIRLVKRIPTPESYKDEIKSMNKHTSVSLNHPSLELNLKPSLLWLIGGGVVLLLLFKKKANG